MPQATASVKKNRSAFVHCSADRLFVPSTMRVFLPLRGASRSPQEKDEFMVMWSLVNKSPTAGMADSPPQKGLGRQG
jgi:hypothetical protein